MKNYIRLIFFIALITSIQSYGQEKISIGDTIVVWNTSYATLEKKPELELYVDEKVKIPRGSILIVKSINEDEILSNNFWYKIQFNGQLGYVNNSEIVKLNKQNKNQIFAYNKKIENLRQKGLDLLLISLGLKVNSVGGVEISIFYRNISKNKEIKYVNFGSF